MSRVTRRKHVLKEMMEDDYELPTQNQQIVRVVCSRGNNLHEVETPNVGDEHFLVTMPTKFRKNVWVKRGDFLLVEPIEEGDKVKAEISKILSPEHIKEYTKSGVWPNHFGKKNYQDQEKIECRKNINSDTFDDDDSDDNMLVPNTNRPMSAADAKNESDEDTETDSSNEDV